MALLEADGEEAEESGGCVLRSAPTMKNKVPIPIAEMNNESLRPSVSAKKKTKMAVATTLTIP